MKSKLIDMNRLMAYLMLLWGLSISVCVQAEEPVAMLQGITSRVLDKLRTHQTELKSHPDRIYGIAESLIVPYVDFVEMGRWIAGRQAWQKASEADRDAFITAFKSLVVKTYATSLLSYSDQTVEFLPLRSGTEKQRLQVSSYIKGGERGPIKMDYRLIREGENWKVYDIVIEGVSLLKGYQAQFSNDARQHGLSHVTEKIRRHHTKKVS